MSESQDCAPPPPEPTQASEPAASRPRRPSKRWIALTIVAVILLAGGIGAFIYWLDARHYESTDDASIDGNIVPISAQIDGRILSVAIADNQDVAKGDIIAQIDPADFEIRQSQTQAAVAAAQARAAAASANLELVRADTEATLTQARAAVAAAEADAQNAKSQIDQAKATVQVSQAQSQSAQADVDAAQAEASRRQADMKRMDAVDPRAISQQQKDIARTALDAAEAQLSASQKRKLAADAQVAQDQSKVEGANAMAAAAESKISQAQGVLQSAQAAPQQVAAAEAQVKTAQADVEQAKVQLQFAQQQLSYAQIVAPIAGRVTRKSVQPGEYVNAGQNLCAIVSPDVWVTANFKETQLTHMHVGQAVEIHVDAYPDRVFGGRVQSIQAGTGARFSLMPPENATGNYVKVVQRVPVKIVFDEPDLARMLLGPGMSVVPRVHLDGDESPSPIAASHPAIVTSH